MENQPLAGPIRERAIAENGYSEEEQAKVIEGAQVDLKQIKKRKPVEEFNRQRKIKEAYRQTQMQLVALIDELQQIIDNIRHQEKILEEVQRLHTLQEELIHCLLLEQKGELSEVTTSQDAWNLIK